MALQGRKPGWLLDKILGRPTEPDPAPAEASALHAPEPPALSPASFSEGQPDFAPVADLPPPVAVPGVEEASRDALPAAEPVEELAGATLQPIAEPPTPVIPGLAENRNPEPTARTVDGPLPDAGASMGSGLSLREPRSDGEGAAQPLIAPPPAMAIEAPIAEEPKRGWFRRLADGMRRTSSSLGSSVTALFTKRKLDRAMLDDLEDVLIGADLGVETATRITEAVSKGRYDREIAPEEVKAIMAGEIEKVLAPVARPLTVAEGAKPFVLLMIGVNGAGKTTTIGKLAQQFRREGRSVTIAAGDTFRAAAIEHLKVWGERVGAPVISGQQGADAAGLAFDALEEARRTGADILMIDTAGRLQDKAGLMAELEKIIRVIRKIDATAPHATLLVLDATVGQNALSQVELFGKTAGVTGLVMTKLDGTARGGILVALAAKFGLPVHFIGVGEGVDDLQPFAARDFARAIAGLDEAA